MVNKMKINKILLLSIIFVTVSGVWYTVNFDNITPAISDNSSDKITFVNQSSTHNKSEKFENNTIDKKQILEQNGTEEIIGTDNSTKIDLNTATADELKTIKGVGDVLSSRIIEYRTQNNGFKTVEELKNIDGIGDKKFNNIKMYIKIEAGAENG